MKNTIKISVVKSNVLVEDITVFNKYGDYVCSFDKLELSTNLSLDMLNEVSEEGQSHEYIREYIKNESYLQDVPDNVQSIIESCTDDALMFSITLEAADEHNRYNQRYERKGIVMMEIPVVKSSIKF